MAIVKRTYQTCVSYLARVRDANGRFYPSRNFETLEEAQSHELELKKLRTQGARVTAQDARTTTVEEYYEVWKDDTVNNVSEGWKTSQEQMFRIYIKPVIGRLYMSEVDAPAVGAVFRKMQKLGRAKNTQKNVYALMHKFFADAVGYYEILVKNPVMPKHHRPKVNEVERAFLKPDQLWKLLDESKKHYLGPAVWLGGIAGLRKSEIQALTGENLFFQERYILIRAAYNEKMKCIQDHPKQKDWAKAPMPQVLSEYLKSLRRGPKEFVAQGPDGGMLSYHTFLPALKRLCKSLGLPELQTHELRHSCTELWANDGAGAEDIRRLLNQKSLSATKRYIHRTEGRLEMLGDRIGLRVINGGIQSVHSGVHDSVHSRQHTEVCVSDGEAG